MNKSHWDDTKEPSPCALKGGKVVLKVFILLFLILSVATFFTIKNSASNVLKDICINSRYYPKHYCSVPKWMRNFFNIKQKTIPKFIYFRFKLSIIFVIIGVVDIVASFFLYAHNCFEIIYILFMLYIYMFLIERIHFITKGLIYKYNTKKKK